MPEDFFSKGIVSIIVLVIAVALCTFWISMLIDCARRTFRKASHRVFWFLLVTFLQLPGAFIYWLTVRRKT